ncbi:hypothetical protein PIB30_075363 [Stylosanthes scabra]|uniref:Uncharacterized protein n=1 Tax=Stylosanthes scabra TaxID=79078 RepID=A0ABU6VPZ7_9FABA|nr:hypothetical protein [Stylosanthes scabra]
MLRRFKLILIFKREKWPKTHLRQKDTPTKLGSSQVRPAAKGSTGHALKSKPLQQPPPPPKACTKITSSLTSLSNLGTSTATPSVPSHACNRHRPLSLQNSPTSVYSNSHRQELDISTVVIVGKTGDVKAISSSNASQS